MIDLKDVPLDLLKIEVEKRTHENEIKRRAKWRAKNFCARDLKKMLTDVPDDTVIVMPGHDHSYRTTKPYLTDIVEEPGNEYSEAHPARILDNSEEGLEIIVKGLVFGAG